MKRNRQKTETAVTLASAKGEGLPSDLQAPTLVLAAASVVAVLWAYWPTLAAMVSQWDRQPDYSHGYLVVPISVVFLWARRSAMPAHSRGALFWGLGVLALVTGLRAAAGAFYLNSLDGWTLPLTISGIVLLMWGWPVLRWSLPAIVFLWFMVPIPYSAERMLSVPLQKIATKLSTVSLVCLRQPAIAEGNVILLGEDRLFIEEACSGLRIFVGILALAFAFVLFSRWSWWHKLMVLAAVFPVAMIANVFRIVGTALLQQYVSSEAADKFSHDLAGFLMIPFAALLFWLFLIYLNRLLPQVEIVRPATRSAMT